MCIKCRLRMGFRLSIYYNWRIKIHADRTGKYVYMNSKVLSRSTALRSRSFCNNPCLKQSWSQSIRTTTWKLNLVMNASRILRNCSVQSVFNKILILYVFIQNIAHYADRTGWNSQSWHYLLSQDTWRQRNVSTRVLMFAAVVKKILHSTKASFKTLPLAADQCKGSIRRLYVAPRPRTQGSMHEPTTPVNQPSRYLPALCARFSTYAPQ